MADPVEFSSLSDEEKQQALGIANGAQGAQPVSGATNMALQGSVMNNPYAPVIHQPGEGLRAGMAGAQQNIANLPIRAAEAMGAQPGGYGMMAAQGLRGGLNLATSPFGSPEGAVITAGIGPMRAAAPALAAVPGLNRLPSLVGQALGLGAVGGTAAGLTGGNPISGAAEGLTAGAVGGILGKASDVLAQRKQDAINLGNAIVKEVPWIEQLIPSAIKNTKIGPGYPTGNSNIAGDMGPLLAIRDQKVGWNLLNRRYWEMKQSITDAVGKDALVTVPAVDAQGATGLIKKIQGNMTDAAGQKLDAQTAQMIYQNMQKTGSLQEKTMSMEKALAEVAQLGALARAAKDGAEGFAARERARQIQEQIDKVVGSKAAGGSVDLLAQYRAAREQYGKGMAIFGDPENNILKKSGVFELNRTGGKVNLGKLSTYLQENIDEYGPTRFPDLYAASNRGAGLGAVDVQRGVRIPGMYGHGLSEHGANIRISQPTGNIGGGGNPLAGLRGAAMSVIPPEWLSQQPPVGLPPQPQQ